MTQTQEALYIPLHDWHVKNHGKMVPFAGYNMPLHYDLGILQEHHHTRAHAGLFDVSHMGVIKVEKNQNNLKALEYLIPADLEELEVGQLRYGVLISKSGGIFDDLIVGHYSNHYLLVVNAGRKYEDLSYLRQYMVCELLDNMVILSLQGPHARNSLKLIEPSIVNLPFMHGVEIDENFWIACSGYTGEDGFELIMGVNKALSIVQRLLDLNSVKLIGLGARDSLRLEAGLCLYGHDINENTDPITANLSWSIGKRRKVDLDFIHSQEILDKLLNKNISNILVGLKGDSKIIAREEAEVLSETGETIGKITSGGYSPTLGYPIAMAYIDKTYNEIGKQVMVKVRTQNVPFTITKRPFVKHNYFRGTIV